MDDLAYFPPGTQTFVGCLLSGLRVRWYERGADVSNKPTVLCRHGFPELAVSWREQLAGLSERYRVVAPDMRGYGGTDAPPRVRDDAIDLGPWFAEASRYTSFVADFDRVLLEDVGHFPAQEAAEAVNAALCEHFERSAA